ncbi:hypothetical protein COHA_004427 [Chlorella ohadii]|uniref:Ketoreductase domain-containing protein n=1 Tax=Chlorella ohadii TaxID=2649997 RepID=A0AAD5DSX6_9CHLO|nr:hypothetical protein COHA_004427 [Chlorella ohadii]
MSSGELTGLGRPRPYAALSLTGKVALITGASSGIGEACAWRLAEAGCKLLLIARREGRLAALADSIRRECGVAVHTIALDVRELEAVGRLPDELPPEFQDVELLVPNAGLALGVAPIQEIDLEDVQAMLETNVTSVVTLLRAFTPGMVQRNRGHIIFIGSIAGHEAYGGGAVYCATKHAIDAIATVVRFKGDEGKADAVYEGIHPLVAADIADNVLYAATRPAHVQVAEILVLATYQCSAKGLARVLKP